MKSILTTLALSFLVSASFSQTLDAGFIANGGPDSYISCQIPLPNHKILVVGEFNNYNGIPHEGAAILNADGTTDESFQANTGSYNTVFSATRQQDGKFILVGQFHINNSTYVKSIVRLLPNGNEDNSFNVGVGTPYIGQVRICLAQEDGKIMVGGDFDHFNGIPFDGLVRLNSDGSLDTTFHGPTGLKFDISQIHAVNNGKYLVTGYFDTINGVLQRGLVQLNQDGSVDNTFDIGTGAFTTLNANGFVGVTTSAVQSDGKIIVAGNINYYDGTPVKNVFRLNTDGSLDHSMQTPTQMNGVPRNLNILPDGKIIVCGTFTYYNVINRPGILLLNYDGSVDQSFNCGEGPQYQNVSGSCMLDNDKVIVYGSFTDFDGQDAHHIARLNIDPVLGLNNNLETELDVFPNPTNEQVTIQFEGNSAQLVVLDAQGKPIQTSDIVSGQSVSLKELQTGIYFFELQTEKGKVVKRVVKS